MALKKLKFLCIDTETNEICTLDKYDIVQSVKDMVLSGDNALKEQIRILNEEIAYLKKQNESYLKEVKKVNNTLMKNGNN